MRGHRAVRRLQDPVAGAVVAPLARVGRAEQGDGRHAQRHRRVHDGRVIAQEQRRCETSASEPRRSQRAGEVDRPRPRFRARSAPRIARAASRLVRAADQGDPHVRVVRRPARRRPGRSARAPQRLPGWLAPGWMPTRRRPRHVSAQAAAQPLAAPAAFLVGLIHSSRAGLTGDVRARRRAAHRSSRRSRSFPGHKRRGG